MAVAWNCPLTFGLWTRSIGGKRNVVTWIMSTHTNYAWNIVCKLAVTNMATVRKFEVIFDEFNIECVYIIFFKKYNDNNPQKTVITFCDTQLQATVETSAFVSIVWLRASSERQVMICSALWEAVHNDSDCSRMWHLFQWIQYSLFICHSTLNT
jgi:hypothetical protein